MKPIFKWQMLLGIGLGIISFSQVFAVGSWNGQDTLHVPLSWCIVKGSPAQADPNVAGDTTTDALIWRRHERPTDNIFINPTGISFRSAINDTWGTLNFPIIDDPDTTLGIEGDMRGEDVNVAGVEYNQMITDCDQAWDEMGRAGIGVTAVNAGLFHDGAGAYVRTVGWGGCSEMVEGTCDTPFDGRIVVIDNRYKHPSVADRSWPDGSGSLFTADPLDQLVAHELGHALSLEHRENDLAMMNPGQRDNSGDGNVDNIDINNSERDDLRSNALNVPGLESDPPGVFNPGRFVVTRKVDKTRENKGLPPYLDLASVRAGLDKNNGVFSLNHQLMGLISIKAGAIELWTFITTDGSEEFNADLFREFKLPKLAVKNTNIIVRIRIQDQKMKAQVWKMQKGEIIDFSGKFVSSLNTLVMHPHYSPTNKDPFITVGPAVATTHIPTVKLTAVDAGIQLDKPFKLQTVIWEVGRTDFDVLDETNAAGKDFVLENPSFPHCFPDTDGEPGKSVKVGLEKLRPNANIHGLLGPVEVFNGKADASGGGVIDLPIPPDTKPGYHLVTIGVDDTALTADCTIKVVDKDRPPTGGDDDDDGLISCVLCLFVIGLLAIALILLVLLVFRKLK